MAWGLLSGSGGPAGAAPQDSVSGQLLRFQICLGLNYVGGGRGQRWWEGARRKPGHSTLQGCAPPGASRRTLQQGCPGVGRPALDTPRLGVRAASAAAHLPLVRLLQLGPQFPQFDLQPGPLPRRLIQHPAGISQLRLVQRLDAAHLRGAGGPAQGEPPSPPAAGAPGLDTAPSDAGTCPASPTCHVPSSPAPATHQRAHGSCFSCLFAPSLPPPCIGPGAGIHRYLQPNRDRERPSTPLGQLESKRQRGTNIGNTKKSHGPWKPAGQVPSTPASPLPEPTAQEKRHAHPREPMCVFTAQFTAARRYKRPQCPSADEQIHTVPHARAHP